MGTEPDDIRGRNKRRSDSTEAWLWAVMLIAFVVLVLGAGWLAFGPQ